MAIPVRRPAAAVLRITRSERGGLRQEICDRVEVELPSPLDVPVPTGENLPAVVEAPVVVQAIAPVAAEDLPDETLKVA